MFFWLKIAFAALCVTIWIGLFGHSKGGELPGGTAHLETLNGIESGVADKIHELGFVFIARPQRLSAKDCPRSAADQFL